MPINGWHHVIRRDVSRTILVLKPVMHNMHFAISVIGFVNQPVTEEENPLIEEAHGVFDL
jgi:hypothetical protein